MKSTFSLLRWEKVLQSLQFIIFSFLLIPDVESEGHKTAISAHCTQPEALTFVTFTDELQFITKENTFCQL